MTQPGWLERLGRVLVRAKAPAHEIVCTGGRLRLSIGDPSRPLAAVIRPRGSGPGWATTDRFTIAYDGARDLDDRQRRLMGRLLKAIRHVESRIPADLAGVGGVFADSVVPEDRFARLFPFTNVERSTIGADEIVEVLLRVTAKCNQACPFCSAPPYDSPDTGTVARAIDSAARVFAGAMVTLTGGEPALRPTFVAEIERAVGHRAFSYVQVQTNAVAFARKIDPASIAATERLFFFVSLHATDEAIYDRCTGTRGQWPLARKGITRLLNAGHRVTLNSVVSRENVDHLDQLVDEVRRTFPGDPELHFSALLCAECNPVSREYLVPYPLLAERLERAAAAAAAAGLKVQPLRSSTYAAIPACMLGEEHRERDPHRPIIDAGEVATGTPTRPWVKAESCADCAESRWCRGVPRPYAERFGLDELRPIA